MAVAVSNHYMRVRYETARRRSKEQQQASSSATYASPASRTILATDTGTQPMVFPANQAGQSGQGQRFPWPPILAGKPQDPGMSTLLLVTACIISPDCADCMLLLSRQANHKIQVQLHVAVIKGLHQSALIVQMHAVDQHASRTVLLVTACISRCRWC